jgi:hypothetical protein
LICNKYTERGPILQSVRCKMTHES